MERARKRQRVRRIGLLALLALVLSACAGGPPPVPGPTTDVEVRARSLIAAGQLQEAGREYLRIAAGAGGEQAAAFLLKAAAAFIDAGDLTTATTVLDRLRRMTLPPPVAAYRDLLHAGIELRAGHVEAALALLPAAAVTFYAGDALARYHRLRAEAYAASGNHLEAARERLALAAAARSPEAKDRAWRAAWTELTRLTPAALEHTAPSADPSFNGWIELARLAATLATHPETLEQGIAAWRARFPGHPADTAIIPALLATSFQQAAPPATVALLLPLQGQFEQAARAVRDGFLGAWLEDTANPERPVILIRDSSAADIAATYRRVVEEGAGMVVGPLRRGAVTALAQAQTRRVPTLALNLARAPAGKPPSASAGEGAPFYQFALSPEEEARGAAERAWFDARARGVVLYPQGDWGERVDASFGKAFEELGGIVAASASYPPGAKDMSAPVKQVLNIDRSEERARALRRVIGRPIERESRRRQDIDFVFLAAFPRQARQIRPQFAFNKAGRLPIYATSHVYTAKPDAGADRDLNGIEFGDMPWVLTPGVALNDPLRDAVLAAWPQARGGFLRLYAFGADAYRLIPNLGRLRAQRAAEFEGATGRLSVDVSGRVHRRLRWAIFKDGLPVPLDASVQAPP